MALVNYELNEEKTRLIAPGTNQLLDWLINLLAIPFFGYHLGSLLGAIGPYFRLKKKLPEGSHLEIFAHSMAAGVFPIVCTWLNWHWGCTFYLELKGAPKTFSWWRVRRYGISVKNRIYGNDPVPCFWPWFKHIDRPQHEGPERTFKGIVIQIFKMRNGDHLCY